MGSDYYVGVKNGTQFRLYSSFDDATTNYASQSAANTAAVNAFGALGTLTSIVGPNPFRTTTLDAVKVTGATLNQAQRFATLSEVNTNLLSPGAGTRLMSNIVSSIELADTAENLSATTSTDTQSAASVTLSANAGIISIAGHGYKTGDSVTYSVAAGTAKYSELTSGATYYVGKLGSSNDNFVLFNNRGAALAADLTNATTARAAASAQDKAIVLAASAANLAVTASAQKFTTSSLDKIMSDVFRLKDNTAQVGRVTIKGFGAITALKLNDIATNALRGNGAGQVTYSAKAVDIQNNIQALTDNQIAGTQLTGKAITEIVVNDGTSLGKKAITVTDDQFLKLRTAFLEGVDKHTNPVPVLAKNYTFNVTGAAYSRLSTLQADMNVGAFALTGVSAANLKVSSIALAADLGNSKLKTMTSVGVNSADRAIIQGLLSSVGSGPDRAKLKLVTQL
jgi:hypothetical protein